MAVAITMDFSGATLDEYDQILEKMGLNQGGSAPPGALFHWASATDDGIHVTDVWESREAFDKFAEEQIGPYSAEVGITEPPSMTYHDVHNHLAKT
jgi:hypothetical protein